MSRVRITPGLPPSCVCRSTRDQDHLPLPEETLLEHFLAFLCGFAVDAGARMRRVSIPSPGPSRKTLLTACWTDSALAIPGRNNGDGISPAKTRSRWPHPDPWQSGANRLILRLHAQYPSFDTSNRRGHLTPRTESCLGQLQSFRKARQPCRICPR